MIHLMVGSQTLTLSEASEACSLFDVHLGVFFVTSWMNHRCSLGGMLVDWTLLLRSAIVSTSRQLEIDWVLLWFTGVPAPEMAV